MRSVSVLLIELKDSLSTDIITVREIMEHFSDRSLSFFLFLFALPAALPLPGLGINLIIAAPLVLLTLEQVRGRQNAWLPRRTKEKAFQRATIEKMVDTALPYLAVIERLSKPRLQFMASAPAKRLMGLCGFIMALSICIPLPLTNTVPSFGIALMALGTITRDGLAVLAGALIGIVWIGLLIAAVTLFGTEGLDLIKETIKSVL